MTQDENRAHYLQRATYSISEAADTWGSVAAWPMRWPGKAPFPCSDSGAGSWCHVWP